MPRQVEQIPALVLRQPQRAGQRLEYLRRQSLPAGPQERGQLLGRSGLRVSPLSLGAMTFGSDWGWGWGSDKDEAREIFDAGLSTCAGRCWKLSTPMRKRANDMISLSRSEIAEADL